MKFSWHYCLSSVYVSKLTTQPRNNNAPTLSFQGICAEEEIRTPTPGCGRYHLKVVRLPISPPPQVRKPTKKGRLPKVISLGEDVLVFSLLFKRSN